MDKLTSYVADSRAKTSVSLEDERASKDKEAGFGSTSEGWLASYDRDTFSWRTSQTCLVALVSGEADGLAEFLESWPNSGMMRSGRTYQRPQWASIKPAKEYGLLPTVTASDGGVLDSALNSSMTFVERDSGPPRRQSEDGRMWSAGFARLWQVLFAEKAPAEAAECHMGIPTGWTDLRPSETQSSPKSQS